MNTHRQLAALFAARVENDFDVRVWTEISLIALLPSAVVSRRIKGRWIAEIERLVDDVLGI